MTRGPEPQKAKEESLDIAGCRGHVQRYQHRKGNLCGFTILCAGLVCFVTAMRLIKLSSAPEDILHEYAKVISRLRFIPSSPGISRELWLRTPRGAWRFFRILDDGILELDRYGMPLANGASPAGNNPSSGIVPAVPWISTGPATGPDGRKSAAILPGKSRDPEKQDRVPDTGETARSRAAPLGPEKDPGPGAVPEILAPEREAGRGSAPAGTAGKSSEPDTSGFPNVNLELFRVFMRQRERRKTGDPACRMPAVTDDR